MKDRRLKEKEKEEKRKRKKKKVWWAKKGISEAKKRLFVVKILGSFSNWAWEVFQDR